METSIAEFVYKLPAASTGGRPGAHRSRSRGQGMSFVAHARLLDHPDPRRLDLRASIADIRRDWLVRTHHQRSAITVHAVVDVSTSMHFGQPQSKLDIAADFIAALGYSAHRLGDTVSLSGFDHELRTDLSLPTQSGAGMGLFMAEQVRSCITRPSTKDGSQGLMDVAARLSGTGALIFIVSDFHWSIEHLDKILEPLTHALIVPLVIWDRSEREPPQRDGLLSARDAESGKARHLWLRQRTRQQWRNCVAQRRTELTSVFASCNARTCFLDDGFSAEQLSEYFLEEVA